MKTIKTNLGDFTPDVLETLNDETFFGLLGAQHAWVEANAELVTLTTVELMKLANLEREADRRGAAKEAA
jgi:hypothetical protein